MAVREKLAIDGGKPVLNELLPTAASYTRHDCDAVAEAILKVTQALLGS